MKIAVILISVIALIILVIIVVFAFLFSLGFAFSILRIVLYLVVLLFRWIRNKSSAEVKDFRTGAKKKINKRAYKRDLKEWKDEIKLRREQYIPSIVRICKNFARAMKLWYKKEYLQNDTVLNIQMGRLGKFAMSVEVFFNEPRPFLEIKGGETEEIYLEDFSEEKLIEALKKRRKYIVY